jgi:hypothetical protein
MRDYQTPGRLAFSVLALLLLASVLPAQVVHVWIPERIPAHRVGDTVNVPVLSSGHAGRGIIGVDITITSAPGQMTGTTLCRTGNAVPGGWMVYANPITCTTLIAMAGADPLVAGDTLVVARMVLNTDSARLTLERCRLNEGQVPCSLSSGSVGFEEAGARPKVLAGLRVSPNPARSWIRFSWAVTTDVSAGLSIRDVGGRLVRTLAAPRATRELVWNGADDFGRVLPSGVYLARLEAVGFAETRQVILSR